MPIAKSWRRGWAALPAAALLYGAWALIVATPDEPARVAPPPVASVGTSSAVPREPLAAAAAAAPVEPSPELPPGVTREQWAAIESDLANRPDASAERQRLRDYLQWSDALRRFREAPAAGVSTAERAALARAIEDGLGERLRHAELSAGEAKQIETAILAATVADDGERAERLRQWAAAALAPAAAPDPRQAAFERRQVELVAAWSAQPASARDPAALERELDALRRDAFAPSARAP